MKRMLNDFSMSATVAGFVAVLIGFASAVAIVFQAAQAVGANSQQIESWIWALGIGMGVCSFLLSLYYRNPIIIVWSTPGAALLANSIVDDGLAQTTGTFLFVGMLILLVGMSGLFRRFTQIIPVPIAAAMLAGVLLQFGIGIFASINNAPYLIAVMVVTYFVVKRYLPRYAILAVLVAGIIFCVFAGTLDVSEISLGIASPSWVTPAFSLTSIVGIGLPLFIVTMASQNLPGAAILKSSGYASQNVSPIISATGLTTLLLAPFGGFTFNLAAITAAICTSEECHHDPKRRYIAGLSAGVFNVIAGVFGATVVGLFAAFPQVMVSVLAGLALLSTIGSSLHTALDINEYREASLITFLVTASGVAFLGIASAFWGLILGLLVLKASKIKRNT